MVMFPVDDMTGKLDALVEISPAIMENGKSVELPEEKIMICASNCEDHTFVDTATMPEDKQMMTCANNCEDSNFQMEVSPDVHNNHIMLFKDCNEDVVVDIVEDVQLNEERVAEGNPQDVTESSSSFGPTDSGIGSAAGLSDMEVESQPRDVHASVLRFDGFSNLFKTRKKKLRSHWRRFIRPLMWRCKWAELQLRELHSQVSKYDRELEECHKKKQQELEKCATEDQGTKATPFISQNRSIKLMKRKKRKRVEEIVDLASYTSSHSLFSYYARKRPFTGSAYINDDCSNNEVNPAKKSPVGSDEFSLGGGWTAFEFKDSDAFESILRKIDEAQLQVHQLRIRMDKVVREVAGKFTSDGSSVVPDDPSPSCAPRSVLPHMTTEKTPCAYVPSTSQHDQVTPLPDMNESTDQIKIEGICEKTGIDVLTLNQPVKEELNNTEEVGIHRAESPFTTERKACDDQNVPDPDSANLISVAQEQPAAKVRSVSKLSTPKNKRKRGRRKARSGKWTRRSSG